MIPGWVYYEPLFTIKFEVFYRCLREGIRGCNLYSCYPPRIIKSASLPRIKLCGFCVFLVEFSHSKSVHCWNQLIRTCFPACSITYGYVCGFVCFSSKVVHLEAASDFSSATFLTTLHRFIRHRILFAVAAVMFRKMQASYKLEWSIHCPYGQLPALAAVERSLLRKTKTIVTQNWLGWSNILNTYPAKII